MKTELITQSHYNHASEIVALTTLDERAIFSDGEFGLLDKVALVVSKLDMLKAVVGLTEDGARWVKNQNESVERIRIKTGRS